MPRPSKPLISRAAAVVAALEIIDTEGLDALSLPRLARHMDVKAPSLYHHFADKSDILAAVARAVAAKTVMPPRDPDGDWQSWFTALAGNFRESVLRHRHAAPLLLQFMPREVLIDLYDEICEYLTECGVPSAEHVPLLDSMEKISLGATLTEAMRPVETAAAPFQETLRTGENPTMTLAVNANQLDSAQLFEQVIRRYLAGVQQRLSHGVSPASA